MKRLEHALACDGEALGAKSAFACTDQVRGSDHHDLPYSIYS